MANFIKLSDNCYLDAKGKLLTEFELPAINCSVHVPPYLNITQNSVITAMNLKQEDDKRYYSRVSEFSIGMCHIKFYDPYTVEIVFTNAWEKAKHTLSSKILNVGVSDDRVFRARTVFQLDNKSAEDIMSSNADDISALTGLGKMVFNYKSVRNKNRSCSLSFGLSKKEYPLLYKGRELNYKSKIFFMGTYGILFDSKLRLSAIVIFDKYNNNYVDVKDVLYIAGAAFYKAVLLSIQLL